MVAFIFGFLFLFSAFLNVRAHQTIKGLQIDIENLKEVNRKLREETRD